MADARAFDVRQVPLVLPDWALEAIFFAFLLVVFVGRQPFTPPAAGVPDLQTNGAGDIIRQILYLMFFGGLTIGALQKRSLGAIAIVPPMLGLLVLWCLLSSVWATPQDVSLRRAILQAVLVGSIVFGTDVVGPERCLAMWRWILGAILIVNLVSIPIVPTAVHLPGETDPALVGNWRGMFVHKNLAGSMSVITAVLFITAGIERKRAFNFAMAGLAIFMLVMTHSKSSLGLLPVALLAGAGYWAAWRSQADRMIGLAAAVLVAALFGTWLELDWDSVMRVLSDPASFTGRTEIWNAELNYIRDHWLLGSGFGTFTDTGGPSPLAQYVSGDWVKAVSHGHNGYLQMGFMLGSVGLVLTVLAFVVVPLVQFWPIDRPRLLIKAMMFAIFVFLILHNFIESDFFQDDSQPGVALLMVMTLLASLESERRSTIG
jgi:exopolysaccharide production protein ExoQ